MTKIIITLFVVLVWVLGVRNMLIALLIVGAVVCGIYAYKIHQDYKRYQKSAYFAITHNAWSEVRYNRGLNGEYNIYDKLRDFGGYKRFLFNLYLPKDDGGTTEIDVIMLHGSGVYVFESKNYHGWIFGSEYQKSWTQTLPSWRHGHAHHEYFMNPIMQNKLHLTWLKKTLDDESLTIHSYIVFGSDCKLKNITLKDGDHHVLRVNDLLDEVRVNSHDEGHVMSNDQIDAVYSRLIDYCMVDESVKIAHIENIVKKRNMSRERRSNDSKNSLTQSFAGHADNPDNTPGDRGSDISTAVNEHTTVISGHEVVSDAHTDNQHDGCADRSREHTPQHNSSGERLCPVCGSQLVIRRASHGKNRGRVFWGCSAFPRCRYIEKIPITKSDHTSSGG